MKPYKPKPLKQQTIVITGASSGIGLATARMAARRGAKVVLSSRNKSDLDEIVSELKGQGSKVLAVKCDVSDYDQIEALADRAVKEFGQIDTWVNNAGGSIYGPLLEIPLEEERKLFDNNFWGIRHGCRVAFQVMKSKGGTIINLGSEVSERAIPLQGMYSASKHAVKAYTDALRMELEHDEVPISVTLVRPTAINTQFAEHGVNHLREGEPSLPSPIYEPDNVARAILRAAVHPKRDIFVGGNSFLAAVLNFAMPRLADHLQVKMYYKQQIKGTKNKHTEANEGLLHAPAKEGKIHGGHKGKVKKHAHQATRHM